MQRHGSLQESTDAICHDHKTPCFPQFAYRGRLWYSPTHQQKHPSKGLAKPLTKTGHCNRPARNPNNCKYLTPLPQVSLDPTMEEILPDMICQSARSIHKTIVAVAKILSNTVAIYEATQAGGVDCYESDVDRSPAFDEELHPANGCWPSAKGEEWSAAEGPW